MNYFRGNLFQTYVNEDGTENPQASVNDTILYYDENPSGRKTYSQLPGSMEKQTLSQTIMVMKEILCKQMV